MAALLIKLFYKMVSIETQYLNLAKQLLLFTKARPNRTGINTFSTFGIRLEHNMADGFPLLTTKKIFFKGCVHELLWFLKGSTNIKYLVDNGVHIWDAWADEKGELGPVYGKQWIDCGPTHINQVEECIKAIKEDPYSRRIIINAYHVPDIKDMALPPCHVLYQFYCKPDTKQLSLQVYMRSADVFLGLPFDIAEGGLLLSLVAEVTGYKPDKLIYILGDAHIYENHREQMLEQVMRTPYKLPKLKLAPETNIFDYTFEDIKLIDYKAHSALKGKVAV